MTYVREQTSAELAAHMRSLKKMPGWFEPLADRLWQEVEMLKAKNECLRKDAERLDWLDGRSRPVVEGQCMASPEGELTGYDWGVFGQCSTVREAIDDAMSMENKS